MPEKRKLPANTTSEQWGDYWDHNHLFVYTETNYANATFVTYVKAALSSTQPTRVLDLGCGEGGWIRYLAGLGCHVFGVDFFGPVLSIAKQGEKTLKLAQADARHLPFISNSFDVYLSVGALEHIKEGLDVPLFEAHRVLAPGGRMVIVVPYRNVIRKISYYLRRLLSYARGRNNWTFFEYWYDENEIRKAMKRAGFDNVVVSPADFLSADGSIGLSLDFDFLKGEKQFRLNPLGSLIKSVLDRVSPWLHTGVVVATGSR